MAIPVVDGAKSKLANAWAYLRSLPPHVWVGLIIGALALILAYIAWKNRNQGLSPLSDITAGSDPTSSLSPISNDQQNNYVPPNDQSGYYNYQTASTIIPHKPMITPPSFNRQIGFDIHSASLTNARNAALNAVYNQNEANGQNAVIAAQQKAAKAAASLKQSASAPAHSYDIHAASQALHKVVPIYKPPTGRRQDVAY